MVKHNKTIIKNRDMVYSLAGFNNEIPYIKWVYTFIKDDVCITLYGKRVRK